MATGRRKASDKSLRASWPAPKRPQKSVSIPSTPPSGEGFVDIIDAFSELELEATPRRSGRNAAGVTLEF